MKTNKENITRHDYEKNHGYVVRYMRDSALFQKMFSDVRYSSPEKALEAAELYLSELKAAFPPMNRREYAQVLRRKKEGVAGVNRAESKSGGKVYIAWVAQWCPEEGKIAKKSFSINKYGEERAKQLAIEAREAGLREMKVEWSENRGRTGNSNGGTTDHHETSDTPTIRDIYAFEGEPIYRIHIDRERDPKLRAAAIENYKIRHGEIRCEVCSFSFEETYGEMGKDLIEIHHVVSLASRDGSTLTRVDELMLICANCHFVIHNGDADENLRRLKILFSGENFVKRTKSANNSMDVRAKQRLCYHVVRQTLAGLVAVSPHVISAVRRFLVSPNNRNVTEKNMIQVASKIPTILAGVAGEYFVAAELSRRGWIASISLRNTRGIDILVTNQEASRSITIQCKTSQKKDKSWILNEKSETFFSEDHFYVFVSLGEFSERPSYYIVPSKGVADQVRQSHRSWLDTPGRAGHQRVDNSMRKFFDTEDEFLERWELLSL